MNHHVIMPIRCLFPGCHRRSQPNPFLPVPISAAPDGAPVFFCHPFVPFSFYFSVFRGSCCFFFCFVIGRCRHRHRRALRHPWVSTALSAYPSLTGRRLSDTRMSPNAYVRARTLTRASSGVGRLEISFAKVLRRSQRTERDRYSSASAYLSRDNCTITGVPLVLSHPSLVCVGLSMEKSSQSSPFAFVLSLGDKDGCGRERAKRARKRRRQRMLACLLSLLL